MAYLRNAWYMAGWNHEISRELFAREILEEWVLLYRKENGEAVAMSDRCPHRFAPLHQGKLIGDTVECPYHGLQFDCSGQCVYNPHPHGEGVIPPRAKLKLYPVVEKYKAIWVWMGEEEPDEALLPDFSWLEEDGWRTVRDVTQINADYRLIADNVLDLSHLPYVHAGGIGPRPEDLLSEEVETVQDGLTVWGRRSSWNVNASPDFQKFYPPLQGIKCDKNNHVRWDPPGHLAILLNYRKAGTENELKIRFHIASMLTPSSKGKTHQFWSLSRDFLLDNDLLDKAMRASADRGLEVEDRDIIEHQQNVLGSGDIHKFNPVPLIVDATPNLARRVLADLIRKEQQRNSDSVELKSVG